MHAAAFKLTCSLHPTVMVNQMKTQFISITALVLLICSTYVNAKAPIQKETGGKITTETVLSTQASTRKNESLLRQVASNKICMVNDTLFKKPQIKITVEGKDYYGCCAMCKDRLTRRRQMRMAFDPLSGAQVDKATAVIGVDFEGHAYYFENESNLKKYRLPILKEQSTML